MAGLSGGKWCNTISALNRLASVLSCPICKSSMDDPCVLSSCNHHFCRKCIESALCESQANCPICQIPAWIKDVQSDRQVATLIKCVSSMNELMSIGESTGIHHIVAESADSTSNFTTIKEFDNSAKPVQRKIKPRRKSSQLCLPFPQMLDDGKPFHFVRVWKGPNASCGEKRVHIHQIKTRSSAKYRRSQNETNDIERNNTSTKWLQSKHSSTTSSQECECYNDKTSCEVSSSLCTAPKTLQRNIRGETPLHTAAIKGDVDMIEELLQQGYNPNLKDNAGWTPLHECCNHGHIQIATLLLDYGAIINAPGFDNDTPLHDAVANGHVDIAKLLISRGANPLLRNHYGMVVRDIAKTDLMRNILSLPFTPELLVSPNAIVSPSNMPIQQVHSNGKKIVLLGTGLKDAQKVQLEETAKQLGGTVVESYTAQGIIKCHQEGQWVEEEPYEVMGIIVRGQSFITEAPRKGRENAMLQIPQLFDGCEFFFLGDFVPPHPSKQDMIRLVKMAGGRVLSREPCNSIIICPYHAKPGSYMFTSHVITVSSSSTQPIKRNDNTLEVSPMWIFDCLSKFQLVDAEMQHLHM